MEPSNKPLHYIEDLLFFDGIKQLMASYINNPELIQKGFDYIEEHDSILISITGFF